mmetsp:Transcript_15505/g.26903  ORF Transcript_15505/g.26903 Transcript_15505/m.26903 type:complete len:162 (-) Transcript_15505:63-548(-)
MAREPSPGPGPGRAMRRASSGRQLVQDTASVANDSRIVTKPSPALLSAGAAGTSNEHVQKAALAIAGAGNPNSLMPTNGLGGRQALLDRMGSLRHFDRGPSQSLVTAMINDGDATSAGQAGEKLRDFNLMSLRLDETLIGGGLEVGRLKCSIDVWWTEEDD